MAEQPKSGVEPVDVTDLLEDADAYWLRSHEKPARTVMGRILHLVKGGK